MRQLIIALLAVALMPPLAWAHSHKKGALEIVHPWTPESTDRSNTNTRVFMTIKNRSGAPDRLVRATTVIAAKVELQEGDGGASVAKPISAVAVPAGKDTDLHAKGPHLLLSGVKKGLNAYGSFKLTLTFERAGRIVVDVMVEEIPEAPSQKP